MLLVSGQGLLLSFALIGSVAKKKYGAFFFGWIVFVITLEVLTEWAVVVQYPNEPNAIPFWTLGSYLLVPPALWFFLKSTMDPKFQFTKKIWWFFVPALIEIIAEIITYYSFRIFDVYVGLMDYAVWYHFTETLPILAMVLVLILFGRELQQTHHQLKTAKIEQPFRKIQKLYLFLAVFTFFALFWLAIGIFNLHMFGYMRLYLWIFIFVFGYLNYFQPTLFDPPKILLSRLFETTDSKFNDAQELEQLKQLFEKDQIYLEQKLTLKMVAEQLKLPQNYVSGLINSYHNTNFSTFVNSYRVEEVKKRMNDPKERNKTLLGIALESGFSSKSSFNKTFKEITGKNPSEFLKNSK
jgi:AraC-like DNA-binding protein